MNRKVSETKIFRNMMEDYFESHGFIHVDKNLYVKHLNDEIRASISVNSGTKVPGLLWFRVSAANANAEVYGISSLKKIRRQSVPEHWQLSKQFLSSLHFARRCCRVGEQRWDLSA